MSHPNKTDETAAPCPLTTVRDLAVSTATRELGTDAENKRVSTSVKMSTAVTEGGKTKTQSVDAGVTLGVATSEADAPAADASCADGCNCRKSS